MGSVGMIVWVVVLHWLSVCDYSFCYSISYQQTVFIVPLCGCIFPIVLFINVFVLCHGTKKMVILISRFTCIYKCTFLIIIFKLSSFFLDKREKVSSPLLSLAEKLISEILTSKLAPSLVSPGLIRAFLSLAPFLCLRSL